MLPDTPIHEPLQANNTLIKNFFIVLEQIIQWSMHMYTIQFSWKEWIHGYYLLLTQTVIKDSDTKPMSMMKWR
jgi:hypothetical protein